MKRAALLFLAVLACPNDHVAPKPQLACSGATPYLQWGQDAAHSGATCNAGQPLAKMLADEVYDPFVDQAKAEAGGDLLAHYQAPLVDGDDVFMEWKSGSYLSCDPPGKGQPAPCGPDAWNAQSWGERKLSWANGQLATQWTFASDWKPPPNGPALGGWEPVFHAALSASALWVPGAGGSVFQVDRGTGALLKRHQPFGATLDPNTFVAGPITVDASGGTVYTVLQLAASNPWTSDATGYLVRVAADGTIKTATFASLATGAPGPNDLCVGIFQGPRQDGQPPLPPSADAVPQSFPCLSQRPGINIAPAIGPDGTIFVGSRAHANARYSYLLAVNPDLTPKWAASLRGLLNDGCGVLLPSDGYTFDCATFAHLGVDPFTNDKPAGKILDSGTSSPVALPDGAVLFGAHTGYNADRGHLLKFDASGKFVAAYDFGWDVTPAYFPHGNTYSIVIKDNHYAGDEGPYQITQLDALLRPEWKFTASNTQSCVRDAAGQMSCTTDHPNGFEWCVNAPVVDKNGVVYANSEDGWLYAINPGGGLKQRIFLQTALGAAYTPLSIDGQGRIYTQNDGHLFVVGQ